MAAPYLGGDGHQSRGRVDGQGRADGQEEIARRRGLFGRPEVFGHQVLSEADGGRLQDPPARSTRPAGSLDRSGRPRPPERACMGSAQRADAARQRRHTMSRALPWISMMPRRIRSGLLMEPVDVLGDQRVEPARALQVHQGGVAGVGLGVPHGRREAVLPRAAAHLGIVEIDLEGGHPLGLGVLRPQSLGPAEVGDARIGGDAGSGEGHDPARRASISGRAAPIR